MNIQKYYKTVLQTTSRPVDQCIILQIKHVKLCKSVPEFKMFKLCGVGIRPWGNPLLALTFDVVFYQK